MEFHESMLSISAEGWSGNSSFADGRDVYASSVERWQGTIPADARAAVEYLCGPEMALTPYLIEQGRAAPAVQSYLERADAGPFSWSSSSGDAAADMSHEAARHRLLDAQGRPATEELRRNFLFGETYDAIRAAGSAGVPEMRGVRAT